MGPPSLDKTPLGSLDPYKFLAAPGFSGGSFIIAFQLWVWFFSFLSIFLSVLGCSLLAVQCPLLEAPGKGTMDCVHPLAAFAYGSSCKFECEPGYQVRGWATLRCIGSGQWTAPLPACEGRVFL